MTHLRHALLALICGLTLASTAQSAGFQSTSIETKQGDRVELSIWYPSSDAPDDVDFGPYTLHVAQRGKLAGAHLPLIMLSHGTGGAAINYFDTAAALADAGFVVAGLMHAGDNYRNHDRALTPANFIGRPLQVSASIDYMLKEWDGHAALDAHRIGLLGHSAGGTTALLLAGGTLRWQKVIDYCIANPDDWACAQSRNAPPPSPQTAATIVTGADPRIRAYVIAAPALTHGFAPDGLKNETAPIQLWVMQQDAVVTDAASLPGLLPKGRAETHLAVHAGHFAPLTPCSAWLNSIAPEICSNPPGFDRPALLAEFQREAVRFFKARLAP